MTAVTQGVIQLIDNLHPLFVHLNHAAMQVSPDLIKEPDRPRKSLTQLRDQLREAMPIVRDRFAEPPQPTGVDSPSC